MYENCMYCTVHIYETTSRYMYVHNYVHVFVLTKLSLGERKMGMGNQSCSERKKFLSCLLPYLFSWTKMVMVNKPLSTRSIVLYPKLPYKTKLPNAQQWVFSESAKSPAPYPNSPLYHPKCGKPPTQKKIKIRIKIFNPSPSPFIP